MLFKESFKWQPKELFCVIHDNLRRLQWPQVQLEIFFTSVHLKIAGALLDLGSDQNHSKTMVDLFMWGIVLPGRTMLYRNCDQLQSGALLTKPYKNQYLKISIYKYMEIINQCTFKYLTVLDWFLGLRRLWNCQLRTARTGTRIPRGVRHTSRPGKQK